MTDYLPYAPGELAGTVGGFDLVIDCTGTAPMTAALSIVCAQEHMPFLTGALFHQGAILRVRRQAQDDTPIADRGNSTDYVSLPPDDPQPVGAFLELGCTAFVNSSPPWAAQRAATDIVAAAIDQLLQRRRWADEHVEVLRPLAMTLFDVIGRVMT